ncbi:GAP family protein [Occultella gossypii]|uniref:GAP family protein n=1 Tax=Occultella gossypii TaxID=2800820 RepID=A0ABS7SGU9_9MICO|nr:GAP family protein [Occultella gossypii]MBZ2199563.1 GAP family protein [Occultella gossypii]
MSLSLFGPLAVLALIDSTSFGTLLIPIWLMLAPGRLRAQRVLVFLATVAVFYFGVGLALLAGATGLASIMESDSPVLLWVQLAVGVALFAGSFFVGRKKKAPDGGGSARAGDVAVGGRSAGAGAAGGGAGASGFDGGAAADSAEAGSDGSAWAAAAAGAAPGGGANQSAPALTGRLARWRERTVATEGRGGYLALIGLALGAAVLEVATMLPYLGAIGLITGADLAGPERVLVLAGYCLVMIVPALVLLAGRVLARRAVEPVLQRISDWMARSAGETMAWIMGILGFLIARDAAFQLGLFDLFR